MQNGSQKTSEAEIRFHDASGIFRPGVPGAILGLSRAQFITKTWKMISKIASKNRCRNACKIKGHFKLEFFKFQPLWGGKMEPKWDQNRIKNEGHAENCENLINPYVFQ